MGEGEGGEREGRERGRRGGGEGEGGEGGRGRGGGQGHAGGGERVVANHVVHIGFMQQRGGEDRGGDKGGRSDFWGEVGGNQIDVITTKASYCVTSLWVLRMFYSPSCTCSLIIQTASCSQGF